VVEDETAVAKRIRGILINAGFAVDVAYDGRQGCNLGSTREYDVAVLDLGLPTLPGLDVLKRWRAAGQALPVLIMTARGDWPEGVNGLNSGADDYLEKPFQAQELVARVHSLVRRSFGKLSSKISLGEIDFDATARVVTKSGREIELTALEFRILSYLMHRIDRIVSQIELIEHVYPAGEGRGSNTIEVYVARLRRKLGRDFIRTVRGMGYRIS
jgi:two-component system OmpR family response regulator